MLVYHLFINVIYFSISSFFNSNIHKILTVCKKTWVMAHQRTVTKNRYIFFIINQGKKDTYTVCIHRRSEHKRWVSERAQSRFSDVWYESPPVRSLNSPHLTRWQFSLGSSFCVTTPVDFHLEPCVLLYDGSFCWSDNPNTSINTIYATIRQTDNQPTRQTVSRTSVSRPAVSDC